MRNWIIGAAAALAAVAAPTIAAAQTGYAGVTYGNIDAGGGDDFDVYGVEGAVAFAGSGSIVFEVDASLLDSDDSDAVYGLTGHVYARNDNHLFGGFVGVAGSDDSDTWTAGLEAAKYYTNWTLAGSVAYANNDDFDVDGYGVAVEGRFFVNDNFRLDAGLGWANVDYGPADDDVFSYGVGGEYQFAALPVSVGLRWSHAEADNTGGDADIVGASLRYNWGGTLRDRDRNGASQGDGLGAFGGLFGL